MKVKEFHINKLCRDKTDQLSSSEMALCREIFPTDRLSVQPQEIPNRHAQNKPKPNPMKNKITIKNKKRKKKTVALGEKSVFFIFYFDLISIIDF